MIIVISSVFYSTTFAQQAYATGKLVISIDKRHNIDDNVFARAN